MSSTTEKLHNFRALTGLTLQQYSALAESGEELSAGEGRVIFQEGEPSEQILFLLEGKLEVRKKGGFITEIAPLNLVGEMGALNSTPRSASVVSVSPVRYLLVSREEFHRLVQADKDFAYKFYKNLTEILAAYLRANNMLVEFYQTLH